METTIITRTRGAYALSPVVLPSMAKPCPHTGRPSSWRADDLRGLVDPAPATVQAMTVQAMTDQGAGVAIRGTAFVTDHFSTRLGPPSCSPPV